MEDLNAFVELLELLLPHMFKSLLRLKLEAPAIVHVTERKDDIPDHLRGQLAELLKNEIEFYEYAKKTFYELY